MKAWLAAVLKTVGDFILMLMLLAGAFALGEIGSNNGATGFYREIASAIRTFSPLAAAAALFLGYFSFELKIAKRAISWISIVALGALFLTGGLAIRTLSLPDRRPKTETSPASSVAIKSGSFIYYARGYEKAAMGTKARDAVAYDTSALDPPRLSHETMADYLPSEGLAIVEGGRYPVFPPRVSFDPLIAGFPSFSTERLEARLAELDGSGHTLQAAAIAGFTLLVAGLAVMAGLVRWRLAGFFFAVCGFMAALGLHEILAQPAIVRTITGFTAGIGLKGLNQGLIAAAIEGFLGLGLAVAGLVAGLRKKE